MIKWKPLKFQEFQEKDNLRIKIKIKKYFYIKITTNKQNKEIEKDTVV